MASLLKAALALAEENDDDAHNHFDFEIAATWSVKSINEEESKEDLPWFALFDIEIDMQTCWSLIHEACKVPEVLKLIHGS